LLSKLLSILFLLLLLGSGCSDTTHSNSTKETNKTNQTDIVIPNKITMLFVTQERCPSCDKLEKTMKQPKVHELIVNYFSIIKIDANEALPDTLPPPFGTPTVYFLGYNNELLIEPMIGEKSEAKLLEFLNDALLEFKIIYGKDLKHKEIKP